MRSVAEKFAASICGILIGVGGLLALPGIVIQELGYLWLDTFDHDDWPDAA